MLTSERYFLLHTFRNAFKETLCGKREDAGVGMSHTTNADHVGRSFHAGGGGGATGTRDGGFSLVFS